MVDGCATDLGMVIIVGPMFRPNEKPAAVETQIPRPTTSTWPSAALRIGVADPQPGDGVYYIRRHGVLRVCRWGGPPPASTAGASGSTSDGRLAGKRGVVPERPDRGIDGAQLSWPA